ncbi:phosphomannose isomerase type II C-terminal cupin domain [Ornithinimicrobium flavum]|uniref:phosphomannose isomerase type II C-terminal cupin domain n=1 Tax=Ornithinimicrobium flavum TaxID=1288636 RepID=UPI00106FEB26|nr:phosphomannose isomerase type II C-terminal cupin domain [Ornithinimicrobium flavum]
MNERAPERDRREDVFVVERPWGRFRQFTRHEPTTVKTITVDPGQRLSLQRHEHRAELWHVLAGPLDVTVDGRSWVAQVGDLVWVPRGAVHRMGNPGEQEAVVLELGFGRFDEDDIERLEDDYSRR